MKRKRIIFTGEFLVDLAKRDSILIENQHPIPQDAKLIKVDVNRDENTLIVEYLSESNPEVVEGASAHYGIVHNMSAKIKNFLWVKRK